ncbi:hypothetical protein GH714_028303 [Hevea brasiliensis]|uniref:Uncharacterized protein n=1 Tax=Hevea brasiliensis TaxID=3981 RepID=A0A6A6NCK5_HEVBR|nr:hypothetical protein GH714_028303 [Hevea brasiliensis]
MGLSTSVGLVCNGEEIDLALREDEPAKPTIESSAKQKEQYAKCERSNRLSLIAIRRTILDYLKSGLPSNVIAKGYLAAIEKRYFVSNKAEARTLLNQLTNMKYNHVRSVRDYILNMVHIQTKLRGLKLEVSDDFIIHLTLNTLPPNFSQIKTAYNTQNQIWSVNDLLSKCDAEAKKLESEKKLKSEIALFVSQSKPRPKTDKSMIKPNHHASNKYQKFKRHRYSQVRKVDGNDVA